MNSLKEKVGFYLDDSTTGGGKLIEVFLIAVNLAACVHFVVLTYRAPEEFSGFLHWIDFSLVSVFIMEYLLRLWTARRKIRFVFSFYALVDLLSIMPVFFHLTTMGFLRSLRVLRILRFIRYLGTEVFFFGRISLVRLQVARVLFTIATIIFVFSGFIYYVEAGQSGSMIHTFEDAVYFSVSTLSTVGFGDLVPATSAGRWVTVTMILSGIVLIPWQAGRLVRLLISLDSQKKALTCKSYGLAHHDTDSSYCKLCGTPLQRQL